MAKTKETNLGEDSDELTPPEAVSAPGAMAEDPWRIIPSGPLAAEALKKGLRNIAKIAPAPTALPSKPLPPEPPGHGYLGFRRQDRDVRLVLACGKEQVRFLSLRQLVALVEHMDDPDEGGTILLQNMKEGEGDRSGGSRGQVLGRLDPDHSAFVVVQGLAGKVIRSHGDIVLHNAYYIPRHQIQAAYLMARTQLGMDDELQNLLELYDGWREFNLPLDLCRTPK